jgi:two-component system chemotaxis response regulator CheB
LKTVLIADDSPTARVLLSRIVNDDAQLSVVGEAQNGAQAIQLARSLLPDVIIMDVQMPIIDGYEATRQIMMQCPTPIVIVTTSLAFNEVEVSMNALRNGALIALRKPTGPGHPEYDTQASQFRRIVRLMSEVRVHRSLFPRSRVSKPSPRHPSPVQIVAIAASTGGPAAIHAVLNKLPPDFALPIAVVQHIAKGFAEGFARWLDGELQLPVKVVDDGELLQPGQVYIAPDHAHLGIDAEGRARLAEDDNELSYRPSADHFFRSLASSFGARTLAVILTGMGNDGQAGMAELKKTGAWVIAQDESSSVVFSMPRSVIDAGLSDQVLPVEAIGAAISRYVSRQSSATEPAT